MKSRKYESFDAAMTHLRSIGVVENFGWNFDYFVVNITLNKTARKYTLNIYSDGLVKLAYEFK